MIFTAVYVEKYCKFFSGLYGCLVDTVCTENLEAYFLRVLVMCFQDIFLLFPLVSVFADTALKSFFIGESYLEASSASNASFMASSSSLICFNLFTISS